MFRLALYQAFKKELDLMMASQETKFKINKVIWTTKSKVIYVRIQYQNSTKWSLGIIPKMSQTKFNQIPIMKS